MAKIDETKERIGLFKIEFTLLVATNFSLIAWLVQTSEKSPIFLQIVCTLLIIGTGVGIIRTHHKTLKLIDELEEL